MHSNGLGMDVPGRMHGRISALFQLQVVCVIEHSLSTFQVFLLHLAAKKWTIGWNSCFTVFTRVVFVSEIMAATQMLYCKHDSFDKLRIGTGLTMLFGSIFTSIVTNDPYLQGYLRALLA